MVSRYCRRRELFPESSFLLRIVLTFSGEQLLSRNAITSGHAVPNGLAFHLSKAIPVTGPPLWCRGQSFWLQIQRSGFDSRPYQIFCEVVCLERGPLGLMSTNEELLEKESSSSGLENREYGRRDPSRWPRGTLYPQKLALTSPTSGCRSVGIVRSRTQATEFSLIPVAGREMLKIPHCLGKRLTDGGKVVSPTHQPRSTLQKHYFSASGTHFC
jgi:hypothetical protein